MELWDDSTDLGIAVRDISAHGRCRGQGSNSDVFLLGDACVPGEVTAVKFLTAIGMIDDGEEDWKILAYPAGSTAPELTTDLLDEVHWWLTNYKSYDCRTDDFADQHAARVGDSSKDSCASELYKVDWMQAGGMSNVEAWSGSCVYEDEGITFGNFTDKSYKLTSPASDLFITAEEVVAIVETKHEHWEKLVTGGYAGQEDVDEGKWKLGDASSSDDAGLCMDGKSCLCMAAAASSFDASTCSECPSSAVEPSISESGDIWTYDGYPNPDSVGHRFQMTCGSETRSFWHDISYKASADTWNFVCEIPKETCAKREVMPKTEGNPLMQDDKKDAPRYIKSGKYPWNYGMIPQTWESLYETSPHMGVAGDKDPILMFSC
mmetsp:Transcript_90649/g.161410  ORF Transcript_90649/g.161410 Transcript_90649/m.161410 type:complete len:377 (+) Transcript_90649:384-1514(+)